MQSHFMKKILTFIAFCCLYNFGQAQVKLTKVKVNKEVEVRVPNTFTVLNPEEVLSRYLSNSTPMVVYGDQRRTTDFSISKNVTRWSAKDSEILIDFYKASILSTYTKVEFYKQEITEKNGQKFIVFEFLSTFKDQSKNAFGNSTAVRKYTYLLYGLRNGHLYVFNFSAPASEKDAWSKSADKMMQSIKFL